MSSDTLIIILPLLALVLAGVSIAGLWYWWSSGQEGETSENPESTASAKAQLQGSQPAEPTVGDVVGRVSSSAQSWLANVARAAITPPTGSAPTVGYPSADGEMVEVLRVLRDLADGSLVIEIGGRRYRSLSEVVDPQVKRRFLGNTQALAQFAQLSASSSPSVWSSPAPETTEQASLLPLQESAPSPAVPQPASIAAPIVPQVQPSVPKTMADEIEELIQLRLRVTPTLMRRSIHIQQAAGGGIRVEVDGMFFDSVAGVTDPEVTAFLQSIIREWESRQ